MNDDTLTRVGAMLVGLRDQVDRLTEHLEARLDRQERLLVRLQGELGEAAWALRAGLLDAPALGCSRCDPEPAGSTSSSRRALEA